MIFRYIFFSLPGYESAFSAYYPLPFSQNATTLKFHMIYTNIGGDYNETSGNFTCRYPGIYIFTLHLHHNASDKAVCDIVRNGQNTVTAYSMPLMQRQVIHLYEAGNSIVLHLNSGDVVTVRCEKDSGLLGYSSFTGILIKAD